MVMDASVFTFKASNPVFKARAVALSSAPPTKVMFSPSFPNCTPCFRCFRSRLSLQRRWRTYSVRCRELRFVGQLCEDARGGGVLRVVRELGPGGGAQDGHRCTGAFRTVWHGSAHGGCRGCVVGPSREGVVHPTDGQRVGFASRECSTVNVARARMASLATVFKPDNVCEAGVAVAKRSSVNSALPTKVSMLVVSAATDLEVVHLQEADLVGQERPTGNAVLVGEPEAWVTGGTLVPDALKQLFSVNTMAMSWVLPEAAPTSKSPLATVSLWSRNRVNLPVLNPSNKVCTLFSSPIV